MSWIGNAGTPSQLLVGEQNRLTQLNDHQLRRLSHGLSKQLGKQIELIDQRIADLIAQDPILRAKAQKLTSFVGVGARTAALLLAQMPELGQLNRRPSCRASGSSAI